MALGGGVLVLLWQGVGTADYLGLGVPVILRAFEDPQLVSHAFALKLLFTGGDAVGGLPGRRGDAAVLRGRLLW